MVHPVTGNCHGSVPCHQSLCSVLARDLTEAQGSTLSLVRNGGAYGRRRDR